MELSDCENDWAKSGDIFYTGFENGDGNSALAKTGTMSHQPDVQKR